jgi:hypothetical protein
MLLLRLLLFVSELQGQILQLLQVRLRPPSL